MATDFAGADITGTGAATGFDGHVRRELGRASYALARFRLVAAVAMTGFGVTFVALEPTAWQSWVLFVSAAVVGVLGLRDTRALRGRPFSLRLYGWIVGNVLLFQTIVIVVSGGIDSPFIIIYVPVAMMSGFVLGTRRRFLSAVSFPVALVWIFAVGALAGWLPIKTPDLLGGPVPGGRSAAYLLTDASLLSFVMVLGGFVGLTFRRALNRAARTAADARQEVVDGMRDRNRELIALSGSIAHELKNPLASIQGLAALLARRLPEGSREAEQTGVLLGEARRMGAILEEFLNFSRPVHGLAVRPIDPAAIVRDAVSLHEGVAAERSVAVETSCDAPAAVQADPRKVTQVVVNLLQNALDASPAEGTVTLAVVATGNGGVRFTVEDDGAGLADEVRGRLFTPGATTKVAGSGLGLVVARSIAEQHGGTLGLEERDGGGVRAVFTLPAAPPARPDALETGAP